MSVQQYLSNSIYPARRHFEHETNGQPSSMNMDTMDPTYRCHRSCVSTSRESTTGLVYMRNHLMHTLTDRQRPPGHPGVDTHAHKPPRSHRSTHKRIAQGPLPPRRLQLQTSTYHPNMGDRTGHLPVHTQRTTWTAVPPHVTIPQRHARMALPNQIPKITRTCTTMDPPARTPNPPTTNSEEQTPDRVSCVILQRLRHMTRGDEACLVCEVGSVVPYMTQQHVHAIQNGHHRVKVPRTG